MSEAKGGGGSQGWTRRRRGFLPAGRPLVLLAALLGGFAAAWVFASGTSMVLSALVAALAVAGAAELVLAFGRTVGRPEPEDTLGAAAFVASGDAMAVVEDGERVVDANEAYLRMCSAGSKELPTPERFLARIPGSQGIVAEMLDAVTRRTARSRAVSFATGSKGRQLEVSVHPLGSARRVLWTVRLAEDAAAAPAPAPALLQSPLQPSLQAPPLQPAPVPPVPGPAAPVQAAAEEAMPGSDLVAAWEHAPAGIARIEGGRLLLPNLGLCRLLGYRLADVGPEGLDLKQVVARDHLARLSSALGEGKAGGFVALDLLRKGGALLPALVRVAADPAATGAGTVVMLPLDAVQAALPEPEAAPSAPMDADGDLFFQRAPLAMALMDRAGHVRAANGSFVRLFGTGAAGRPLADLVNETGGVEALLAATRGAVEPPAPCDIVLAGGGGRTARLYAAALGSAAGGEIALCAIDTTEQKQLEAQFAESQKLQAVGHLAGGVAHDFNNMLTAIIGYCDLLLAKHRQSDPSFPDIMQIKQNANRAAGLVRQLLAFSRRQTLRPQAVELTDVISDVTALLRRLIGERITLEVQHARDLWPVKVDVNQFEQVIINLAVNARDAMPDGGTLTLRTANVPASECNGYGQRLPEADYVLVEVADTGTGIPPEIMDKIFEPFFSTKEVGKGTGLGLSTVYGIVEQTGGTILVESTQGKGTVFRVFLPRHEGTMEEAEAPRAAEPADGKGTDLTGQGRVLLVEDEDAVRAFASRALANRGYEVLSAASGVEALEIMERAGKVDLVVSDVVMPEMDGPTLLLNLRARDPALKVIFISGYAEEAFSRNLPPGEHFSFLPKPFSLKQLVAAVSEALHAPPRSAVKTDALRAGDVRT